MKLYNATETNAEKRKTNLANKQANRWPELFSESTLKRVSPR